MKYLSDYCMCKSMECKDQHHYYLFPLAETKIRPQRSSKPGTVRAGTRRYTEAQEEFLYKLSPELAWQCQDAFCNAMSRSCNSAVNKHALLVQCGLQEFPVIVMLLDVTANAGQKIGMLIDLASDPNYIKTAHELNLWSEDVTLVVHGVGGMKVSVETKQYQLKI